ncbi:insulin-degrading enzyme-like [Anneissia japonica]|uniref:insulin-degrading enzyme-like n=1 Tax=Anneissia japonica TaxID=1529436 RepID=UPI00142569E1|nr:insulin-degrading enzyme-like [Anneissia japonica]
MHRITLLIRNFSSNTAIKPDFILNRRLGGLINTKRILSSVAMHPNIERKYNDIVKSAEDKRLYRGLLLKNGMKILMISDPTTEKAAAAMDIHIGSLSDPWNLPGLAHFLEHMLFLGTKKYPEENAYMQYLSEHGGSSNAFTSGQHTNYYFDVGCEHFSGALDRFAQFFLCPLLNEEVTDREVNAVDQENTRNVKQDNWRLFQLEKSTSKKGHVYTKFNAGNKDTLQTIPLQEGINVREELLNFHSQYYSSNIMALTILGKDSLDQMESMITELFGNVENKSVEIPVWLDHPYGEEQLQVELNIVPIKDLRQLNISFPIPDMSEHYLSKPSHYLGHLVGHEGSGSLLSELKAQGWVNMLCGGEKPGAKGFAFFTVTVDLSEEGLDHIQDIIMHVFQYLNMLRQEGPQEWIHRECQDLDNMRFRFKDKERPSSYVMTTVANLHEYPFTEVLSADYTMPDYRPDLIKMILGLLTPDKARISVVSKSYEGKTEQKEKWYGTEYSAKKIPAEVIQKWQNAGFNPKFSLPEKNDFIPTDFSIVPREEESSALPVLIRDTPISKVWHKQDDTFLLPKACYCIDLTSPLSYRDPLHTNLTRLFTVLVKDTLNEYAYAAEIAGIGYSLDSTVYGLYLNITGYNDKQDILLKKILEKLTNLTIDVKRFELLKEMYSRMLKNFNAEQPHQHAVYYTAVLMSELAWTKEELSNSLDEVTVERLTAFIPQLLSRLHIEALFHGNLTKQRALEVVDMIETVLNDHCATKPLLPSQLVKQREIQLPDGCYYQYHKCNDVHDSSGIEMYYQVGLQETQQNMLLELLCQVVSEPCFDTLRTQEQLGYIVFSGVRRSNGVQGLRVIIQSNKVPSYLDSRVEAFLMQMKDHITNMKQEDFEQQVSALAVKRSVKPKKLTTECRKYWSEISSGQYNFDRDSIEVACLKNITKENLIDFFNNYIDISAPKRHKISVYVKTSIAADELDAASGNHVMDNPIDHLPLTIPVVVGDVTDFKSGLPLFPRPASYIDISPAKSKL